MDILIKGMEKMPRNCEECDVKVVCKNYWKLIREQYTRPSWCPLILVSPHGRLIDADAAIADIRSEILEHQMNGMKGTPLYIEDLRMMWQRLGDEEICPTIIPASEEETEWAIF